MPTTIELHPAQENPRRDSDAQEVVPQAVASEQEDGTGPSPSETNLAGVVERQGRVEVHGITSIMYEPRTRSNPRSKFNGERKFHHHQIRDELVGAAMAVRQRPVSVPIDFDGLDPETALHLLNPHQNPQHLAYLLSYDSLTNDGPCANHCCQTPSITRAASTAAESCSGRKQTTP